MYCNLRVEGEKWQHILHCKEKSKLLHSPELPSALPLKTLRYVTFCHTADQNLQLQLKTPKWLFRQRSKESKLLETHLERNLGITKA